LKNETTVYIRVDEGGELPVYKSVHSAGCDIFATEDMVIRPGEIKLMPLNFVIALQPEIEAQIRPRSGLSLNTDLRVTNSPGTIDSDYRDVVGVIMQNTYNIANLPYEIAANPDILIKLQTEYQEIPLSTYLEKLNFNTDKFKHHNILQQKIYIDQNGNPYGTIYIKKRERIAQMVFNEYKRGKFVSHPNPESIGENRGGGFGHTGV
jgi:dUTP pyrophosphatase